MSDHVTYRWASDDVTFLTYCPFLTNSCPLKDLNSKFHATLKSQIVLRFSCL